MVLLFYSSCLSQTFSWLESLHFHLSLSLFSSNLCILCMSSTHIQCTHYCTPHSICMVSSITYSTLLLLLSSHRMQQIFHPYAKGKLFLEIKLEKKSLGIFMRNMKGKARTTTNQLNSYSKKSKTLVSCPVTWFCIAYFLMKAREDEVQRARE